MDDDRDPDLRAAIRELRQSLERISGELADVSSRVERVDRALRGDEQSAPAATAPPAAPPAAPVSPAVTLPPAPPAAPVSLAVAPPPTVTPPISAWPQPQGPPVRPATKAPGSWADTAGQQALGWVGGGVTVLGIVLLLVIAVQQGGLSPTARVVIGLVLGIALILGGAWMQRHRQQALAVTLGCTGLSVEFLTVIGAVRLAEIASPVGGLVGSAVIVAVAVLLSIGWGEPWLAGVSFLVGGLLAPAVGGGVTDPVLGFEAIMVAGGAVCLWLDAGRYAWTGAGLAAIVVFLVGLALHPTTMVGLLVAVVLVAITWGTMLGRWVTGRGPVDPGPFPVRVPARDPAQVARDYADFHAHQRRRAEARVDAVVAAGSLAASAGLLVLTLATMRPSWIRDVPVGVTAVLLAAVFLALCGICRREPTLSRAPVVVTAWSASIALVALALLRLIGGDARGVAWVMVAAIALAVAAADRSVRLLIPALGAAGVALLATGPVLRPAELLLWDSSELAGPSRLIGPVGLLARGWTVVLPTGLAIVVLCAVAWWAVTRCTADAVFAGGTAVAAGPAIMPASTRITVLTWALVGCVVAAIYGVLAVTMVLAYAISPTEGGYQGGQVAVTALITITGLLLLWQGFRQVVLRIGGLVLAAVAVAKLLLFDTRSLSAMPRAVTFVVVGVLLLASAAVYLRTMSRSGDGGRDAQG